MKSLFFILTAMTFYNQAQAFPVVGDMATYANVVTTNGFNSNFDSAMTVTAVNEAANSMTVLITASINGEVVQSQSQNTKISDFAIAAATVDHCSEASGTTEALVVANVSYTTCHITSSANGTVTDTWFAKVPFSILKTVIVQAGETQTMILSSFKAN